MGKDRIRCDHVHPHAQRSEFQAGNARQLVGSGLGGAVGAETRARGKDVLGRHQHDVAARALQGEVAARLGQHQQRALHVDAFELAKGI